MKIKELGLLGIVYFASIQNTLASPSRPEADGKFLGFRYWAGKCTLRDLKTNRPISSKEGLNKGFYEDATGAVTAECSDLRNVPLVGKDLSDMDFMGADLTHANLMGSNMIGAMLLHTRLTNSNLQFTNLSMSVAIRADMKGANLQGANLAASNLTAADLSDAQLLGANLYHADLYKAVLLSKNLQTANFQQACYHPELTRFSENFNYKNLALGLRTYNLDPEGDDCLPNEWEKSNGTTR